MESILMLLGGLLIIPIMIVYSSFSWGWIMYKFWGWFLLPVFPMVPHVHFYQCIGLMVFISLFKNHTTDTIKDEYKDGTKGSRVFISLINPWLVLGCGWIVYLVIR